MNHAATQVAALALAALTTLGIVAGINGLATQQYAAADRLALAQVDTTYAAVQRVVVVGHRANA